VRFLRRSGPPGDVLARAGLSRRERPLAWARTTDGRWVLGTRTRLVLVGDKTLGLAWEEVEAADWDQETERLRVVPVGRFGEPRPTYVLHLDDPRDLLQLLRERVMASIVVQRRVEVRGRGGLTVIGRRSPAGGRIHWMHEYDEGVDPADPEVQEIADRALAAARADVGE
jgi:hypothetical protein